MTTLQELLDGQLNLQIDSFELNPTTMTDEERAEFVRWNVLALIDELSEMLDEVGWKPWAKSRFFNRDPYVSEGIDALHFYLNLLLVANVTGEEVGERYFAKRQVNANRQATGYTGTEKCVVCGRALDDAETKCKRISPSVIMCQTLKDAS